MALSKRTLIAIVVGAVLLFFVIFVPAVVIIATYNSLTRMEVETERTWAEVDNQLLRRNDLIPNLVETVKGYAAHEKELFEHIADARARLAGASTVSGKINAANELTGFLSRLLAIAENYPQLRASENFMKLQDELAGTENRIAVARTRYNQAVTRFNAAIRVFPQNMVAGMFGFEKKPLYQIPETAREAPKVKF